MAADRLSRRRSETIALPLVLPALTALLALLLILIAEAGAGRRRGLEVAVLALGAAAALLPLRRAMALAVVLASLDGFLSDFAGPHALYWNEIFIASVAARSIARRRPYAREVAAVIAVGLVWVGFLVAGTEPRAVFWAAKVLLTSVVLLWAVARSETNEKDWYGIYHGLAVAVGVSVALAGWQRSTGIDGLRELGVPFGSRIKETPEGALRAFGGFTSAAPFSYVLVIALFLWLGLLVGQPKERRLGLYTVWVPVGSVLGINWSLDRTALVGLCAAVLFVLFRPASSARAGVLALATAAAVVAVLVAGGSGARSFFLDGVTSSATVKFRLELWRDYAEDLSAPGAGPAAAGSAYEHLDVPDFVAPLRFGTGWHPLQYAAADVPFRWMRTNSVLIVRTYSRRRPPLTLRAEIESFNKPRRLTVEYLGRAIANRAIRPYPRQLLEFRIPPAVGAARLQFTVRPPAQSASIGNPSDHRLLALSLWKFHVNGIDPPTPALRVYHRAYERRPDVRVLAAPGVVDNLYLSWIFQYGFLGLLLCGLWLGLLLWPMGRKIDDVSLMVSTRLVAIFLIVAATTVNIWEESPVDFIAALVLGLAVSASRSKRRSLAGPGPSELGDTSQSRE